MTSNPIQTRLRALAYPRWQTFNLQDKKEFRTLVVWLEEMKIRALEIPKRQPLRAVDSPTWDSALSEYLKELEYPRAFTPGQQQQLRPALLWLLGKGIAAEYADHSSLYNEVKKGGIASGSETVLAGSPESLRPQLETLATALRLPIPADVATNPTPLIQACKLRLNALKRNADAEKLFAAANASKGSATTRPGAGGAASRDEAAEIRQALAELDAFPLGFDTGDRVVNRAAGLLRLAYIQDLRELQSQVNEVIAIAQEFTADPKTDARLGAVGR